MQAPPQGLSTCHLCLACCSPHSSIPFFWARPNVILSETSPGHGNGGATPSVSTSPTVPCFPPAPTDRTTRPLESRLHQGKEFVCPALKTHSRCPMKDSVCPTLKKYNRCFINATRVNHKHDWLHEGQTWEAAPQLSPLGQDSGPPSGKWVH